MKKTILITLLCASLMLVTPLTSIAQENKISNNQLEQSDVDGLVAQIRTVVDEVLQKYGHIPIISSLCNVILNSLGLLGNLIICIFLFITIFLTIFIGIIIPNPYIRYQLGGLIFLCLLMLGDYCSPYNKLISKLPFESIYTMLETKDKPTNTFDICSCL